MTIIYITEHLKRKKLELKQKIKLFLTIIKIKSHSSFSLYQNIMIELSNFINSYEKNIQGFIFFTLT